jgi:hypothetical protein
VFKSEDRRINALAKEKWFPIYGGGIDIAKAIPNKAAKSPAKAYHIAIRRADDIFNSLNGFESRVAFKIEPRYNQKFNKDLAYDPKNERITLSATAATKFASIDVVYKFDFFAPSSIKLSANALPIDGKVSFINVPADDFSLGATVLISTAPQTISGTFYARSKNVKFKVPKQPNPPTSVKVEAGAKRITGLRRTGQEYAFVPFVSAEPQEFVAKDASWQSYTSVATVTFTTTAHINTSFPGFNDSVASYDTYYDSRPAGDEIPENEQVYVIYVRTAATAKAPASPPVRIEIPRNLFPTTP